MAQAQRSERRATRPPTEGMRTAPFGLIRSAADGDEPNDGFTLDGYGAVFNRETVIDDWEGRYREKIALGSMKRSFRETPPKIQFDHGRHPLIGSIPIASLRSVSEDSHPELAPDGGAHIVGRVFDNWLMQPVRDAIAAEAINGMSFRFSIIREGWETADGKPIRNDDDLMAILRQTWDYSMPDEELPLRTLKELQVPEMGPVVWPAYADTSVGVRSSAQVIDLGRLRQGDPEQRRLLAEAVFIADATVGERQADSDDAQRSTPSCVGERPSKPQPLGQKALRLRNQRDQLLNLRSVGER